MSTPANTRASILRGVLKLIETVLNAQPTPPVGTSTINITPEKYVVYRDAYGILRIENAAGNPIDLMATAGEYLPDLSFVYLDTVTGLWFLQDTDASPPRLANPRGIVNYRGGIQPNAAGLICIGGVIEGFSGLTRGPVYASPVAGGYTQIKPVITLNGPQMAVALMGYAVSSTAIMVTPSDIEYFKRVANLASLGTVSINHHNDSESPTRVSKAFGSANATVSMGSYPLANMDAQTSVNGVLRNAVSQPFTPTSTGTLNGVRLMLSRVGAANDTLTCAIYTAVAGQPNTLVAAASATLASSTLTTTPSPIDFAFAGASLTAGTGYYIVLSSTGLLNALQYVNVGVDTSAPGGGMALGQTLALLWIPLVPTASIVYELTSNAGTLLSSPIAVGTGTTGMSAVFTSATQTTFTNRTGGVLSDVTVSEIVK